MKSLLPFSIVVGIVLIVLFTVSYFYKGRVKRFNFKTMAIFIAGYIIGWMTLFIKIILLGLR